MPTPMPKRQREDSGSPNLPPKVPKLDFNVNTSAAPFRELDFRSSQTDSTFPSSEHTDSDPDDHQSDGDRPEIDVTVLMGSLLKRICEEHGDNNGCSFSVGNDVETLTILICGSFPRTKPDLLVRMHRGTKVYPMFDVEVWFV